MENPEEFTTVFLGEKYTKWLAELNNALNEIEKKHFAYFISRPSKNESEPHDFLHNHYELRSINPQKILFNINDDSDLDINIQNECHQAFQDSFSRFH